MPRPRTRSVLPGAVPAGMRTVPDRSRVATGTAAAAGRAGLVDHPAAPAAAGADLGERERPLVDGQGADAVALGAVVGDGAGGGARPAAGVAGGSAGELDGDSGAPHGVVEGE